MVKILIWGSLVLTMSTWLSAPYIQRCAGGSIILNSPASNGVNTNLYLPSGIPEPHNRHTKQAHCALTLLGQGSYLSVYPAGPL